jgi:hypothetical protein
VGKAPGVDALPAQMSTMKSRAFNTGLFLIFAALAGSGCASYKSTSPPRSATEQLLLSTAVDRAMASADLALFANQKVFLDTTYFDSYDSKYAIGEIRDALSRAGALLEANVKDANVIIEIRAGALSTDSLDTLIGVPNTGLPIPLAGTVSIPELALYKKETQFAYAKIALLAYANQSRAHIFSSGSLAGKSYDKYHKVLFISWVFTDIPEKQTKAAKVKKYQSWFPQYDLVNLPVPNSVTNPPSGNESSTNETPVPVSSTNSTPTKTNDKTNAELP